MTKVRVIEYQPAKTDHPLYQAWMELLSEISERESGINATEILTAVAALSAKIILMCASHNRERDLHAAYCGQVEQFMLHLAPVAGRA